MNILDKLRFKLGRGLLKGLVRGYADVVGADRHNSDWIFNGIGEDADLQQNWPMLVQRSRDLFKTNPYMRKFRTDLIANVFGSEGITLQMKIKEETDRVVYADDGRELHPWAVAEKAWLEAKQRSHDELRERAEQHGLKLRKREFVTLTTTGRNGSTKAKAVVKAGQPDVYANNLIERAWKRWQKRENCTVSKRHTYAETRHQRLTMCARDGDVFIRHVRGKTAARNEFGYAIQLISAEWIDHALNCELSNGHYIKMGIEYDEWDAVVAYYVIKRKPGDWRNNTVHGIGSHCMSTTNQSGYNPERHERVASEDMIHYCVFEDSDSGRCGPWISTVMTKLRHLDKYSEAEVITARADACTGGHYETDMPGADPAELADEIAKIRSDGEQMSQYVEPAMWKTLPPFWRAKAHNPTHPNANYPAFKKEALREICAGIGDQYITFAGDLEGTSYSSGRIGSLDVRELWMLTQSFDINSAEIPIFEAWLEMALMSGAIPLPLTKFEKFNQPQFQGRRWPWVDPLKDAKGDAARLEMFATSEFRITNENGQDFEEIVEERALARILIEEAGFTVASSATIAEELPDGTIVDQPAKPAKPAPAKSRARV